MESLGSVDTAVLSESQSMETTDTTEKQFPLNEFLTEIGLSTPIDYVFQTFAIQKSRLNVSKMDSENLLFLFHVMKQADLKEDIPFPRCAFLEKIDPPEPSLPSKYIIWAVEESLDWKNRKPLPFTDFHLYFNDVLHPNLHYSAEELYKVFDARHDETYFINNGPRSGSADKKFHVLFVTEKVIVALQIPHIAYDLIPSDKLFQCKWVSINEDSTIMPVSETAVFHFPRRNLVFTEEEKKMYNENMELQDSDVECKECQA